MCRCRRASAHKRRAGEGLPPANVLPLGSTRKPEPQQSRRTATGNRNGSLCSNPTIRMANCPRGGIESQQRSQGAMYEEFREGIFGRDVSSLTAIDMLGAAAEADSEETDIPDMQIDETNLPEPKARAEKIKERSRRLPAAGTKEVTATIYQQISNEELESQGPSWKLSAGDTSSGITTEAPRATQHGDGGGRYVLFSVGSTAELPLPMDTTPDNQTPTISNSERTKTYKMLEKGATD
ncbi:hypothetical protein THAR02_00604 [Trichoderma harzianum]|uniref:Uncharacterized protein n=1 Tax=Trichoderma harzianum TaxID=5544 RepID=A0A0F9XS49_TRIHA|nr:hypothetical protein THAR02_00604 [Trichoderma harzianum]